MVQLYLGMVHFSVWNSKFEQLLRFEWVGGSGDCSDWNMVIWFYHWHINRFYNNYELRPPPPVHLIYPPPPLVLPVELLWVHILLPGYSLSNTRWIAGYPFNGCSMFSALRLDQDCQNRPTRSQDMEKILYQLSRFLHNYYHVYCRVPPTIGLQDTMVWGHEWRAYPHVGWYSCGKIVCTKCK